MPKNIKRNILLKRAREDKHYTQKELADEANIPYSRLVRYECGMTRFRIKDLNAIARALGLENPKELLMNGQEAREDGDRRKIRKIIEPVEAIVQEQPIGARIEDITGISHGSFSPTQATA